MNKMDQIDFISYAYSPLEEMVETKQRIVQPVKNKVKIHGSRTIKGDEIGIKIVRIKSKNKLN